jgi:hypothetical protein
MIATFLDPYELKARIAPGLILALPVLADVVYATPVLTSWPLFAASSVCTLALLYGLSIVVRALGKAVEPRLWHEWGGPPSTRLMRYRDTTFGTDLKRSIQKALVKKFSTRLLTPEEESTKPEIADSLIIDAFRQVRQYLRQHDPRGLWFMHDIEYGFCRNLLGCRILWVLFSVSGAIFAAAHAVKTGTDPVNPASTIATLSLVCAAYVGWVILPDATKRTADAYAESAWMAFLRTAVEEKLAGGESGSG